MGGAFVALADDATAAYSNPAGLTLLSRREVSVEVRSWDANFLVTERGRISGTPTGEGIDTESGLVFSEESADTRGFAFASYVESTADRRWSAAVYYHVLAQFEARFDSQGVFSDRGSRERFGPYRFATGLEVDSVGVAFSRQFGDCVGFTRCLRLGASVAEFGVDLSAREVVLQDPPNRGPADFSGPGLGSVRKSAEGDDVRFNAGLLWEARKWSVGIAYRDGPEFELREIVFGEESAGSFRLSDQLAVGVAVQPTAAFSLAVEVDRVRYPSLIEDNRLESLDLEVAHELRLGAEYVFFFGREPDRNRLSVMAGAWHDPDHRLVFVDPIRVESDLFRAAYFPDVGEDELHLSAGLGLNLGGFQIDLAADVADTVTTVAVSVVVRLARDDAARRR